MRGAFLYDWWRDVGIMNRVFYFYILRMGLVLRVRAIGNVCGGMMEIFGVLGKGSDGGGEGN